jgi:hypothetical protein
MKDVLMPLLLVLLEDVVVKPGLRNTKVRLETMLKLLTLLKLLQLETLAEAQQQVDIQREVAAVFLPAVVQLLLPAVRETAAAAAAAGDMNDDSVRSGPHLPPPAAAAAAGVPEGWPSAGSSLEHLKLQLSTVLAGALDVGGCGAVQRRYSSRVGPVTWQQQC